MPIFNGQQNEDEEEKKDKDISYDGSNTNQTTLKKDFWGTVSIG